MGAVYLLNTDSTTKKMESITCANEDKELQRVLERNPDLLPGDQMDPDDPCRWMLIKREMPVPDPYTGLPRYSLDFFFVDQNATPTFVECKRFESTESRRQVVGQMLEYAANGQHFWSASDLQLHAEESATKAGKSLNDCFTSLHSQVANTPDELFKEAESRLKAGTVRLIFFLEQAPHELKRVVEFLNNQMQSTEVFLVEARQYQVDGIKVVVPTLFGFTERAREIKRNSSTEEDGEPAATSWDTFQQNALSKGMEDAAIQALRKIYETCKEMEADIAWGRGHVTGSFSPKWPAICGSASPFSIYSTGRFEFHFPSLRTSEAAREAGQRIATALQGAGLQLPADYGDKWFSYSLSDWLPKADELVAAIRTTVPRKALGATLV